MNVYLPIADMSVNLFLVVGIGALVGLFCGIFGVGGGFLLTPFMMIVGIPPAVAVASDTNQIVAGATSGAFAHWRLGNVDMKMGLVILVGGVAGGGAGVELVKLLRNVGNFQFAMKLLYVLLLGLLGLAMFVESLRAIRRARESCELPYPPEATAGNGGRAGRFLARFPLQMSFPRSGIEISALLPLTIGGIVGMASAMLGVGGGFIMVPAMIYLLNMPTIKAVGTSLFQIVLTSSVVTFLQASTNQTVDVVLALCLLVGSTVGAQVGVRISKRVRGEQIRILLSVLVLAMMVKLFLDLTIKPADRFRLSRSAATETRSNPVVMGTRRVPASFPTTPQPLATLRGAPASAQSRPGTERDGVITDETTQDIDIGLSYGGERIELFGTLGATSADSVIVRIMGPIETVKLNEAGGVGPFWATRKQHTVERVPFMYRIDASDKIESIIPTDKRRKLGIGFTVIRADMQVNTTRGTSTASEREEVLDGLFRLKERQGLYRRNDDGTAFSIKRGRLFRHALSFPPSVQQGEYRADTFAFKDGHLVGNTTDIIHVHKAGLEAKIVHWANDCSRVYGVCAVLLALGAGLLVGFVFRDRQGH